MAKLKDIKWNKEGKAGDEVSFTSTVTVNSDGVFYLSFPDFLVETARSLKITNKFSCKKHRIISKTLEDGQDKIGQIINEYLACEEKSEIVIRYDYIASCHYAKDSGGKIYPNGTYCRDDYQWNKPIGRTENMDVSLSTHDYSIGFKAKVVLKTTYTRSASKQIKYSMIDEHKLEKYGRKLNSFVKVVLSKNSNDLPYNEHTAKLFYESMLALCHVADRLDALLNRPDNLLGMSDKLLIT